MKTVLTDVLRKLRVVVSEAFSSFRKNNDLTAASSLAFSAMLALIPALFLLTSLVGAAVGSSQQALARMQDIVQELIPTYSREILREVQFLTTHTTTIGAVNAVLLLWTITPLVSEMRLVLGIVFKKKAGRPFLLEKLLDVAITIVFLVALSAMAAAGVALALAGRFHAFQFIPAYFGGFLPLLFVAGVVFALYYLFAPRMRTGCFIAGALVTSLLWFMMRPAFTFFLTYNPGYGFAFRFVQILLCGPHLDLLLHGRVPLRRRDRGEPGPYGDALRQKAHGGEAECPRPGAGTARNAIRPRECHLLRGRPGHGDVLRALRTGGDPEGGQGDRDNPGGKVLR